MKILYLVTKSNWGGAQRYVFDLATSMKTKGYQVVVVLGGDGILKTKLESQGVRTISIASLGRDVSLEKDMVSLKRIYEIIKTERPDVLHLNSPKAAGLGAFSGRMLGVKKIVYTVHGWTFNEDRPLWQKSEIVLFSWLTMLFCDTVILLSDREQKQTLRFPFVRKKISVIPLGIQVPNFLSRKEAREKLSIPLDAVVIGSIGELTMNKNYLDLIIATTYLPPKNQFILVVIGDGEQRAEITNEIKKNELSGYSLFIGFKDDASQYLKAFDVFVLPSIKEGLPYVLLEAGLASLPVIATLVGGVPEIIENAETGILIEPRSSKRLAEAIKYLLITHPKEGQVNGNLLRTFVIKKFSFEKMVTETNNLYLKNNPAN